MTVEEIRAAVANVEGNPALSTSTWKFWIGILLKEIDELRESNRQLESHMEIIRDVLTGQPLTVQDDITDALSEKHNGPNKESNSL